MKRLIVGAFTLGILFAVASAAQTGGHGGELLIRDAKGATKEICPLKRTSVNASVSGFGARVSVVQTFVNPSQETIEAVYTFPLPSDAAVDRMRMKVGDRIVEGSIHRRDEARQIYEAAKSAGQSAALLDQERANIFTQSIANVTPGATVQIEISYVQVLKYENGLFEFSFPMTVGPRFLGNAADPDKIDPPRGTRVGTDIDLTVNLDAGAPILEMSSVLHEISKKATGQSVQVTLKKQDEIPNRDFILRYRTAGTQPQTAFLTQTDARGGFFTLIALPPQRPVASQIMPREVIFVMDQSGSQSGFPIEKSKELTLKMIKQLRPGDTFNVIGFNNAVRSLWSEPRANSQENIAEAEVFVRAMQANGGTQLREGVVAALQGQNDPARLRMVLFNTDGYVGDEAMILDTIQKQRERARMFTFGIGNAVNRFLIDSMAEEGKGGAEYVTLAEDADAAVNTFVKRTQTPVLTDLKASFTGVTVSDVQPSNLPDLFGDKPVVLYGRFSGAGKGSVTLTGKLGGKPWSQTIDLEFKNNREATSIPTLWARKKVAEIERTDYLAQLQGQQRNGTDTISRITDLALQFGIMTQYTSFVAVESRIVNIGGKQRTIRVPVEQADGVNMDGDDRADRYALKSAARGGGGGGGLTGGQGLIPSRITYITYDPNDNSIIVDGKKETPAQKRDRLYEIKTDKKLKASKGAQDVMVYVSKLDEATIELLKKAGMKVAETDKGMKLVFGSIDAAKLKDLASVEAVLRIERIE